MGRSEVGRQKGQRLGLPSSVGLGLGFAAGESSECFGSCLQGWEGDGWLGCILNCLGFFFTQSWGCKDCSGRKREGWNGVCAGGKGDGGA